MFLHGSVEAAQSAEQTNNGLKNRKNINNIQTMSLLESTPNFDIGAALGGAEVKNMDNALVSEVGPAGLVKEVLEGEEGGEISIYVVQAEDTLSQVAEMFSVSVNTIVWANDISRGDLIKEGQTLVILPISGVKHKIKPEDTLDKLAKKYEGDAAEILSYNNLLSEKELEIGMEIIIPGGQIPTSSQSTTQSKVAVGQETSSGYYMRPIAGGVKTQGLHGYNAVDLASAQGAEIYAAAAGRVTVSQVGGWNGGYGNYVVISHSNGTQTLYSHLSRNSVSVGQQVSQGQVIGLMGSTGRSTGPHLHFEVRGATNPF